MDPRLQALIDRRRHLDVRTNMPMPATAARAAHAEVYLPTPATITAATRHRHNFAGCVRRHKNATPCRI